MSTYQPRHAKHARTLQPERTQSAAWDRIAEINVTLDSSQAPTIPGILLGLIDQVKIIPGQS